MQLIYLKNEFFYNPQVSIHQMKFDSLVNLIIILLHLHNASSPSLLLPPPPPETHRDPPKEVQPFMMAGI